MELINIVVTSLIALITIYISLRALKENTKTRKASFKPLLIPSRINNFVNDDNLFACNVEYPLTYEALGEPKLVYFGIKNIGKGPAKDVHVLCFQSEEEAPHIFRVGSNNIKISENLIIPFVIRAARQDETEYYNVTYTSTIAYKDIFGEIFHLSVRLWIRENRVSILEYQDVENPKWQEYATVVFREAEANGFFETRKIEELLNRSND